MRFKKIILLYLACILTITSSLAALDKGDVVIVHDPNLEEPAIHGLQKIEKALLANDHPVAYSENMESVSSDYIILAGKASTEGPASSMLKVLNINLPEGPEALVIKNTDVLGKPAVIICGSDEVGLMYAALDIAESISRADSDPNPFTHVNDISEKPYVKERAISIYTMHRRNFEQFLFDEKMLERYFDMLAANRINSFVVVFGYENGGFMAPAYPYFFDVDEFPEVKLTGLTQEQQEKNTRAFKRMIRIAHARGIRFCPAFWDHIYRGKVQGGGIPGASEVSGQPIQHLVSGVTTENLVEYNKAGLRKFMKVFPDIDAIQFRVHWESGLTREETPAFWHDMFTVIKQHNPDILIDLRAKGLPDEVIEDAISQGINFRITTKYWMEQMGMPFHPTHINKQNQTDRRHGYADLLRYPQRYDIHWRMWNGGTSRFLLWGDPEYVRRFAESTRIYNGKSFEINDMLATKMLGEDHGAQPFELLNPDYQYYEYEFERYWHFYQTWGRVSYNPDVSSEIWKHEFYSRFGREAGTALKEGLHLASEVLPRIVSACYPYGYFPTTRGWAEMMTGKDLPYYASAQGSDIQQFMNMSDHAQSLIEGTHTAMRRPTKTSQWFRELSDQIMDKVSIAENSLGQDRNKEFISTIADLKILSKLAEFHSHRLLAGVEYNLYLQTGDLFAFDRAIELEQEARDAWAGIVEAAGDVYSSELIFGVHRVGFSRHWAEQLNNLDGGLDKLKEERTNTSLKTEKNEFKIAHVPVRSLAPGKKLKIQSTIFSNQEIDRAEVSFNYNEYSETIKMEPISQGMYEAVVNVPEGIDALNYSIIARDTKGNMTVFPDNGEKEAVSVKVSADRKPPEIRLERISKAKPGHKLSINAMVSDPSGLKWIRLRYRHLTQFEDYQTVDMKIDPATGLYHASIPGDFIVPDWNIMYFVEAVDNAGNGCMIPDLEKEMPYVIVKIEN